MNEGDNLGTANGGATQQGNGINNQSFDPPKEAITSTPTPEDSGAIPTISTAGVSNSSKYFGARGRRGSHNQFAEQQTNYAAAQNIASNPNTPQFFSDAVMADNPHPVEPPKKSKLPLFAGIAAAVILLVVVIVVVVIPKGGGEANDPTVITVDKVDGIITREQALEALDFEKEMLSINQYQKEDDSFFTKSYYETLTKNFESYKTIANNLNGFKKIQGEDEKGRAENVAAIEEKMQKALPVYEKIVSNYKIIYAAKKDNDLSKLKEIDDATAKNTAKDYIEAVNGYEDFITNKYNKNGCNVEPDDMSQYPAVCRTISAELNKYEEGIDMTAAKARQMLIGDMNTDALDNAVISDDLMDVMAYIGELKMKEDRK